MAEARGGLPKPPFLGVSGAVYAACCAHARPCASIRIASIYIYRCLSQLLVALLGVLHGMLHGMLRHGEFSHVWCPQTPFSGKMALGVQSQVEQARDWMTSPEIQFACKTPRLQAQNKYPEHAESPRESKTCWGAQSRPKRLNECMGVVDVPGDGGRKIGATGRPRGLCWMEALSSRGF